MDETIKVGDKVNLVSQTNRYPGIVKNIGYMQSLPGEPIPGRVAIVEWDKDVYSSHITDRLRKIK